MERWNVVTITVNDVLAVHDRILMETGGEYGILNLGNIEFTVDFILTNAHIDSRMGLLDLAAVLTRDIIQGHPFIDGNKRTGMELLDIFLRRNGFNLSFLSCDGIQFALDVAMGLLDLRMIKMWILDHSKKLNIGDVVVEGKVTYMTDDKKERKRENPYNISDEMMEIIDESIKRNKKFLIELAKY